MKNLEEKLKNPVWYALNETHKKFLIEFDGVQFYQPDVNRFGAFFDETKTAKALNEYSKIADNFFLVSENQVPVQFHNVIVFNIKSKLLCEA
jgi:hypothetical protein